MDASNDNDNFNFNNTFVDDRICNSNLVTSMMRDTNDYQHDKKYLEIIVLKYKDLQKGVRRKEAQEYC